jgi:endonuclease/exonuclease/phosphatase family metal-dependent hydrolase
MPRVVVASYNVHGGVDGWGRPFDVVEACRRVDADVLMLQESWSPDDGVSMAQTVARRLGYAAVELSFARGRIVAPSVVASEVASDRWGPHLWARSVHGMRIDRRNVESARPRGRERARSARKPVQRGAWGIAVLSRLPVQGSQTVDLGKLPTDPSRRGAIVVDVELPGTTLPLRVAGTHLAHLSQGSPLHINALRRALHSLSPVPSVLAGDMNLWGPPLVMLFPGWARAVRGRTWPAWWWRPVAQSDHILVRRSVKVESGEVLRIDGSDHLPLRATLVIE